MCRIGLCRRLNDAHAASFLCIQDHGRGVWYRYADWVSDTCVGGMQQGIILTRFVQHVRSFETCYGIGQVVGGSFMGRLSDFAGRRAVLLMSMLGAVCGYSLAAFAIVLSSPWLLLASRLPVGLAKQTATVSRSMIADITSPGERSRYMGRLTASFACGYAIGPLIGTWLVSHYGDSAPTIAASLLFLFVVLPIVYFLLPETRRTNAASKLEKETKTEWLAPLLTNKRLRWVLFVLLLPEVSLIMYTTTSMGAFVVARGLSKDTYSVSNTLTCIVSVLSSVVGIPWLSSRGWTDSRMMQLAQAAFVALCIALLVGDWAQPYDADTGITNPSLLASTVLMGVVASLDRSIPPAIVSHCVDADTQGGAMGALDLMSSCCRVCVPVLCGLLIDFCGVTSPFFLQSLLCTCAVLLVGTLAEKRKYN